MKGPTLERVTVLLLLLAVTVSLSCRQLMEEAGLESPRLPADVRMQDVAFHSAALGREMPYRVILPQTIAVGQRLPVVYLLHGRGGNFRTWSASSGISTLAARSLILVMPEGDSSYYTNSVENPKDRYEDYIVKDLIRDVESRFPVAASRETRAIVGESMGGYGAVKLALKFPDLFFFAGGLSPALDVPSRPFSMKRYLQWRFHSSIFGPAGSKPRHENDPFVLARTADPARAPYLYLECGDQEGLLAPNHAFADLLARRHIQYEFHVVAGGHDWNQWNKNLGDRIRSMLRHIHSKAGWCTGMH